MDSFADFLSRIDVADREIVEESVEAALQCEPTRAIEFRLPVGESDRRFVRQRLEAVTADDKSLVRLTGVVQDVTEQRQAEEKIQYLAYYDGLTGLPNRRALDERLELALASAKRSGRSVALLYFDIDRFKRINDTAGHTMGDQLLQGAAARLLQSVRATDIVGRPGGSVTEPKELVCRFGGDEFVALLTDLERPEQSAVVARRLMAAMADDFEIGGESIRLTASLGIAAHPEDGATAEMLIRNAAAAVSHCKERGGNQYQFYSESMNTTALEHLVLEAALSKAVGRDELVLHYQPQYDVTSGRIVGAEALLRWQHRDLGLLTPDKFIPLAEETGLIVPIGEWVLQEACRQAVEWQTEDSPLRMSVNVSSRQVLQGGLEEAVQQALVDSGLDSSLLELELTESTLLQDKESIRSRLDRIQSLGVGLSIDDFGTGYSALSYLARFPLETLKIDRSFVNGTPGHATNDGICRAIVAMAGSLRLRVIAEGVETEEQLDFLRKEGCFQVQGFLYSRPLSAEAFTKLLQSQAEIQPLTAVGTC
jgi:predicted signal transduction protein with EAL and GGDEF domain